MDAMLELNFPNAVRNEKDFFGRKIELDNIVQVLLAKQPVLIKAERRFGKTSVQNVALSRLGKCEDPQFVPLLIEPQGIKTLDEFAVNILQKTSSILGKSLNHIGLVNVRGQFHIETVSQFDGAITRLLNESSKAMFVLCIDEIDEIIRNVGGELSKTMGLLSYLSEKSTLPINLFFTMTRLPEALQDSFPTPFTNIVEIVELPLFTEETTQEMINKFLEDKFLYSEQEVSWLYRMGGGHPYFTKLLISSLLKNSLLTDNRLRITPDLLDHVLEEAVRDPRAQVAVENLYRVHFNKNEKELISYMVMQSHLLTLEELRRAGMKWVTAAKQLCSRHYLVENQGRYDFKFEFLRHWLLNWDAFEEEDKDRASVLRSALAAPPPEIEVDEQLRQVRLNGRPLQLSVQEYQIMRKLAEKAGTLVPREELIDAIWRTTEGVTDQTVDTAVYRLRKKLGNRSDLLRTIPGQGFILNGAILISK
jgi:hypothetical protein